MIYLAGGTAPADAERPSARPSERPLSLVVQPARPGELLVSFSLTVNEGTRRRLDEAAACAGLPAELVTSTTIEASRLLRRAGALCGASVWSLSEALDHEAASPRPSVVSPQARRLAAYARAIRAGGCATTLPAGQIRLPVGAGLAAAWAHEASLAGWQSGQWAADQLIDMDAERALRWEHAAAECGQALGEWLYAALLMRR